MLIFILILLALLVVGAVVFLVFGGLVKLEGDQKKAEGNAVQILDAEFDGRPDVTFTLNMRTLKYETVMTGAKARGYKLVNQASDQYGPRTLMFEKASEVVE